MLEPARLAPALATQQQKAKRHKANPIKRQSRKRLAGKVIRAGLPRPEDREPAQPGEGEDGNTACPPRST